MKFHPVSKRNDAQFYKPFVLKRAKGYCELCSDFHPFTLECHHVIPVEKGGDGCEDNLIALCPTCHAVIEKLKSITMDNPRFHDWIQNRYGEDGYNKFSCLLQQEHF